MSDFLPVRQTRTGEEGNCFVACLAALLHLPIEEVPDYRDEDWSDRYREWLRERGFAMKRTRPWRGGPPAGVVSIAGVEGPRGWGHAVLWQDGRIVHDPYPGGDPNAYGAPEDWTWLEAVNAK